MLKKSSAQPPDVQDLRVEYLQNPLGIDMPHSRLSWKISGNQRGVSQSAYQILVATSPDKLTDANADVWNTGKVSSNQSVNVVYDGNALKSNQTYCWKTKVWNEEGEASTWSSMAHFHAGPMQKSDWKATWISAPDSATSAPLMRKEFNLKKNVKEAYAYIVGLGYYELYLNGDKVGDHVLDPGTTDFFKRALYATYDVTKYLRADSNAIGVWLGNGYLRHKETRQYSDRPQLLFQLHVTYEDGSEDTFVSDRSWKSSPSPITENSIYDGEVYDAAKSRTAGAPPALMIRIGIKLCRLTFRMNAR